MTQKRHERGTVTALLLCLFYSIIYLEKEAEGMFQNPYLSGYNMNAYAGYGQNAQNTQPYAQRSEVVKVNGRNGADAYQLAPNSSILLLDEREPIIWLKTTDGAGYATVNPYSITPYQPEPPIDIKSLEERIARLEGRLNEQSDITGTRRGTDAADSWTNKKYNVNDEGKSKPYSYAEQSDKQQSAV